MKMSPTCNFVVVKENIKIMRKRNPASFILNYQRYTLYFVYHVKSLSHIGLIFYLIVKLTMT